MGDANFSIIKSVGLYHYFMHALENANQRVPTNKIDITSG
jgi:hypothetical protein